MKTIWGAVLLAMMMLATAALAALLLAPWVCAAALVLGFLFKYGIRFEKDAVKMN